MNPNRDQRAFELFMAAVELPREYRAAFLVAACREDAALRALVEDLLAAHATPATKNARTSPDEPTGQKSLPAESAAGRGGLAARHGPADTTAVEPALGPDSSAGLNLADALAFTAAPPESCAAPPSDSFAGYQIVREIHRGGQGVVYQAFQKSTRRKVAIKVMREGPFAGASDRIRFEREVQVLGQLKHPNIVAIHDAGVAAGWYYFVMDYISGQPLDEYVRDKSETGNSILEIRNVLTLFATVCDAVNAAHLRGVIHRDLKPGNIRVDESGEPHVLDFGLAKVAATDAEGLAMTQTGQFVGSLPWAAPEQAEGAPSKIDSRTDVYALGVILYQLLTGRMPYDISGNLRDALNRIVEAEPIRPTAIRRQIDDSLESIVLKCLKKDRGQRYQTAGEIARDIRRYLIGETVAPGPSSAVELFRLRQRRRRLFALTSAIMLLLIGGVLTTTWLWLLESRDAQLLRHQMKLIHETSEATPSGACCHMDSSCRVLSKVDCMSLGGEYLGDGTSCRSAPCPERPARNTSQFGDSPAPPLGVQQSVTSAPSQNLRIEFTRDPRINIDNEKSPGRPLELAIVFVTKDDVKRDPRLDPANAGINSYKWFDDCEHGPGGPPFGIPYDQIFRYANKDQWYGNTVGEELKGSVPEGEHSEPIKPFARDFPTPLIDRLSCVYIIARYQNEQNALRPTRPIVVTSWLRTTHIHVGARELKKIE